ncbi:phospholipase D family protein [Novosphingobium sp. P6W]|uniref:phospholipase D family protein n=1 Tax=Novosphingobium sp. P6W TaxID=1609758 RepID=UPI0009E3374A|nr:phospholipase D family protein [Novosphingobium sp. P6W]AXB77049.1 phospholipase D family protein [Novosphingobium sp. P6W]
MTRVSPVRTALSGAGRGAGRRWAIGLGSIAAAGAALCLASRLPRRTAPTTARLPLPGDSSLSRSVAAQTSGHPGLSGVHLLSDGIDAFAARLLLARTAERTLDLQYYIWHGDRTGTLLLEAVHEAARRGVRVRLLLDDNGITGLDHVLSALNDHPDIEVRLFNPFRIRFPKTIGFLTEFGRLNRRMHNKSFTVDGAVTIVGGRNVGDEYFGAGDGALFADLDVMAIGPVVRDVEQDFERYWNSVSAYPAAQILARVGKRQRAKLASRASVVESDASARRYVERLRSLPLVRQLAQGDLDFEWAKVEVISDDPAKALRDIEHDELLAGKLDETIGEPLTELAIVSGYFVPGQQATDQLCALAQSGVAVSVLTNGYGATDVAMVHAGYAPWRKQLLKASVRLFETGTQTRGAPTKKAAKKERRKGNRLGVGSRLRATGSGSFAALRSGASTIHAKTITVDRTRLFIGSFNFDPRSYRLNTELGFVIHSPLFAAHVADAFDSIIPDASYAVSLGTDGELRWSDGTAPPRTDEPGMRLFDRVMVGIASRLPIAWLL